MSYTPTPEQSFRGSALKIARARKHLAELKGEIVAYIQTNPARFEINIPDPPVWISEGVAAVSVKFHIPGVPDELGPIIGDVVHNLRSSLDMMACELVRLSGRSDKGVYFPFCETADDIDEVIKKRNFYRAGVPAVELLKSYQPHRGGNIALRALHDLANRDKHHTLIPTAFNAASPVFDFGEDPMKRAWPPKIVGDSTAASDTRVTFPPENIFAGEEVVPTLQKLVDLTVGIVKEFAMLGGHPLPNLA